MTGRIANEDYTATFDDSEEAKQAVFQKLLTFFTFHEAFSGESVMQCDGPQIAAPELLSEIADEIFKFKVEHKDPL